MTSTSTDDASGLAPDEADGRPDRWARLPVLAAAVAIVLLVVGTIGPPLFGRGVLLPSDSLSVAYPWRAFEDPVAENTPHHGDVSDTIDTTFPLRSTFGEAVRDGTFLEWSPYPAGGTSVGGTGSVSTFSPFQIAYVAFPSWYAPAALKLLQLAAAIGFTFLFCRRLGVERLPAIFAGLAFAGSGFMVLWTNWPHSEVAALFPALFWATERFIQQPSARTAPPIALAVVGMLLGVFPAIVLHALYVLVPYTLVRVALTHRRSLQRAAATLAGAGAAVVTGGLLSAFVLLPFAERLQFVGADERSQNTRLFLGIETLITTVAPKALGLSTEGPDAEYYGRHVQGEAIAFVGVTTAILALLAVALPRAAASKPGVRPVFGIATVVIGWPTFAGGEALRRLQSLPGFEESFVGRSRGVLGLTVAVLAALGLQAVLDRNWPATRRQWAWAAAVTLAAALVFAYAGAATIDRARRLGAGPALKNGLVLPLIIGIAVLVVLTVLAIGGRRLAVVAAAAVPLLLVVESLDLSAPLIPNEDRSTLYPTTPGLEFLADNVGHDRVAPQEWTLFGSATAVFELRSVTGHTFHAPTWKQALTRVDPDAFARSKSFSFLGGTEEVVTSPVLDRLGARWFAGVPGTLPLGHRPTSTAIDTDCERTVEFDDTLTVTLPVDGGLRGVVVRVCDEAALAADGGVEAQVDGASASARLPLGPRVSPGEMAIALPADDLDAGPTVDVDLRLTGADGEALALAAGPDGEVLADPVVPADDGVRVAYVDDLVVYERTNALPRIRWAGRSVVEEDPHKRLDLLADPSLPADTVVLSEGEPIGSGADADIDVVRDGNGTVVLEVDAAGAGHVVVADAMQHGWRAEVDGERVDLVDADHAGVAVAVPEGRHTVTLTYEPPGRRAGLAVSAVAAIALAGVWVWGERRHRRARQL